jgi:hypothetical protein
MAEIRKLTTKMATIKRMIPTVRICLFFSAIYYHQ